MKWLFVVLLSVGGLASLLMALPALAHGGGELLVSLEPAGPYAVSVWMNPPVARVNEPLHFTVGVADPADGTPVLDVQVQVEMALVGGETAVSAPATTEQALNKLFYETDLELAETGLYRTTVSVQGPAGSGEVTFDVDVQEASGINWLFVGVGGLVLVLVGGFFLMRRREHPPQREKRRQT